jgi:hypothetical protein
MEMNSEKIKPDTCPCCDEAEPSWAKTKHGMCDSCMQMWHTTAKHDNCNLAWGIYKNAFDYYMVYAPEDDCYEAYDYQDVY